MSRSVEKKHVSNRGCRIVTWKISICTNVSANDDDTILVCWMVVASRPGFIYRRAAGEFGIACRREVLTSHTRKCYFARKCFHGVQLIISLIQNA
jgi:hypothetical protein